MQRRLQDLAARILRAQDTLSQLAPFNAEGLGLSMREAYQVSALVHEERLKSGCELHGKLLLGEKRWLHADRSGIEEMLASCEVSLFRDGELLERAPGRDVLGSPLLAVAALVDAIEREASSYPLQPGELITTGTLAKAYPVLPGECWQTRFSDDEFPGLRVEFR